MEVKPLVPPRQGMDAGNFSHLLFSFSQLLLYFLPPPPCVTTDEYIHPYYSANSPGAEQETNVLRFCPVDHLYVNGWDLDNTENQLVTPICHKTLIELS